MLTIAFFIYNGWIEVPLIKRVRRVVLGSGLYLVHLIRSAAPKTDRRTHQATDSAKIPAQAPTGNSAIIEEDSMDFFGQMESFQFTEAQKRSVVVVPSHHIHNRYFPPIGLSDWIAYCTLWKYSIILNPFLLPTTVWHVILQILLTLTNTTTALFLASAMRNWRSCAGTTASSKSAASPPSSPWPLRTVQPSATGTRSGKWKYKS